MAVGRAFTSVENLVAFWNVTVDELGLELTVEKAANGRVL
jgi:hypothetical protein